MQVEERDRQEKCLAAAGGLQAAVPMGAPPELQPQPSADLQPAGSCSTINMAASGGMDGGLSPAIQRARPTLLRRRLSRLSVGGEGHRGQGRLHHGCLHAGHPEAQVPSTWRQLERPRSTCPPAHQTLSKRTALVQLKAVLEDDDYYW